MFIIYDDTDGNVVWEFGEDKCIGDLNLFNSIESIQEHIAKEVDENNFYILAHDLCVYELTERGTLDIGINAEII